MSTGPIFSPACSHPLPPRRPPALRRRPATGTPGAAGAKRANRRANGTRHRPRRRLLRNQPGEGSGSPSPPRGRYLDVPRVHRRLRPARRVEVLQRVLRHRAAPAGERQLNVHGVRSPIGGVLPRAALHADALRELLRDAADRARAVLLVRRVHGDAQRGFFKSRRVALVAAGRFGGRTQGRARAGQDS